MYVEPILLGHKQIDKEHLVLFNLLNFCQSNNKGTEDVLDELVQYCINHFESEEMVMVGYPQKESHIESHNQFVLDLTMNMYISPNKQKVVDIINKWINEHIKVHDKSFVNWKNNKGK